MKSIILTFSLGLLCQTCLADSLQEKLQPFFGSQPMTISPYDGDLKEITIGQKTYFASHNGRYIFVGPIFDTQTRQDIVERRTRTLRQQAVAELPKGSTLTYPATVPEKYRITVFTDIDCGYCRKFHSQMSTLNAQGISVQYVLHPIAGQNSKSYAKAVAALCSQNPQNALTAAMAGIDIPMKTCSNNILEQMQLANTLNVNATPTAVFPDGSMLSGLMTVDKLKALLGEI